jgi:hypothetical protein
LATNVESSITQKKRKRVKKEKTKTKIKENIVDNVVMHKNPKDFNEAKCKVID